MQRVAVVLGKTPILEWLLVHIDRVVLALTRGRTTLTSLLTGLPTFTITTLGARSGVPRTHSLLGVMAGESILLVASNFGRDRHPGWYYNLRAHPVVQVTSQGQQGRFVARETRGEEARRCLEFAIAYYPGYSEYVRRAHPRQIQVVVLTQLN